MNINPALQSLIHPLDSLHLDPKNARKHDDRSVDGIAKSLTRFGQQKPIVILPDGVVIAGNGIFAAAKKLGWTGIAAIEFTGKTPGSATAFGIADNRTAELSEWDQGNLVGLVRELKSSEDDLIKDVGFSTSELDALLSAPSPDVEPLTATPTICYTLVFDSIAQQDRWFEFLRGLKARYGGDTVAGRLEAHISALSSVKHDEADPEPAHCVK